jgi:hypothetical protein
MRVRVSTVAMWRSHAVLGGRRSGVERCGRVGRTPRTGAADCYEMPVRLPIDT